MKIHQIFINDSGNIPEEFPFYTKMCQNILIDFYGIENYFLYSGEKIKQIIKDNFDSDVYKSYLKLKPYACKADLARYCILYLYGGLYVDLNTRFLNPLDERYLNNWNFFAFRDMSGASIRNWSVSNSIIFTKEKSKVLEETIKIVVNNCKKEYYGIQPIEPTACIALGQSIILSEEEMCCINGELICMNSSMFQSPKKQLGFFTDYGDLIALRKPSDFGDGDLKSIGFKETNNYVEMWEKRDTYNTNIKF